jgi:ParB family chromosome partitioning protein
MHTAAIAESGYRNLPLSMLDESSTNPRRTFELTKLVELAQSLTIHGLIQPITVRPKGERFEVVAGARRFRAAQIAELADVPTRILELSDEQTVEIQIVENAQRQDVHFYEEATGYQRLLDFPGYDVAALASKCGKSQSHIYARLSLLQLIPDVAEAFQQERITASHANLIARLTPEQQAEAFKNCFRKDWQDTEGHLLPAKHLAAWIDTNLYLALAEAPFPTDDPTLNAEAGACLTCPRRTGFNTQLFVDVEADHCLDAACYGSKVAASIAREIAANPEFVQISTEWRPANERQAGQLLPTEYRRVQPPKERRRRGYGAGVPSCNNRDHHARRQHWETCGHLRRPRLPRSPSQAYRYSSPGLRAATAGGPTGARRTAKAARQAGEGSTRPHPPLPFYGDRTADALSFEGACNRRPGKFT